MAPRFPRLIRWRPRRWPPLRPRQRAAADWLHAPLAPALGLLIPAALAFVIGVSLLAVSRAPLATVTTDGLAPAADDSHVYDSPLGYRLRYPLGWTYASEPLASLPTGERVVFRRGAALVTVDVGAGLSVEPLIPTPPTLLEVDGQSARRYRDYDAGTGQLVDRVLVDAAGRQFLISGSGAGLDRFLASFAVR